jgi:hypothetical protein
VIDVELRGIGADGELYGIGIYEGQRVDCTILYATIFSPPVLSLLKLWQVIGPLTSRWISRDMMLERLYDYSQD